MSYCPNCGVKVAEGMKFCPGCGTAVSTGPISCPNCGSSVSESMRFCTRCGTEVSSSCPKCGSRISPDMNFCGQCGQPRMKERKNTSTSSGPSRVESRGSQAVLVGQAAKQPKNVTIALLLAIFLGFVGFWGIGHIYAGRMARGLALLLASVVLDGIFAVLYVYWWRYTLHSGDPLGLPLPPLFLLGMISFVVWIWQILDARHVCQARNQTV